MRCLRHSLFVALVWGCGSASPNQDDTLGTPRVPGMPGRGAEGSGSPSVEPSASTPAVEPTATVTMPEVHPTGTQVGGGGAAVCPRDAPPMVPLDERLTILGTYAGQLLRTDGSAIDAELVVSNAGDVLGRVFIPDYPYPRCLAERRAKADLTLRLTGELSVTRRPTLEFIYNEVWDWYDRVDVAQVDLEAAPPAPEDFPTFRGFGGIPDAGFGGVPDAGFGGVLDAGFGGVPDAGFGG